MANILITAPSLNENFNISGISSLTKTIINNSKAHTYFHFSVGRKDSEGRGLKWIIHQLLLIPRFVNFTRRNSIDVVHLNTDFTPASIVRDYFISTVTRRLLRRSILLHVHGGYLLMNPPNKNTLWFSFIVGILNNATTRVVLSEVERDAIQNYYGVTCSIVPNAVEVVRDAVNKDFSGQLSLLFMGRIVKSKGVFQLAQCLADLNKYFNEIELKIYGVGPDLQEFQSQLSRIPGLSYEFCGVAIGRDKTDALRKAHIFLLPSLYGEGLPIALLESMNYGCVPVVSDDASIGTVVNDGINGYLVRKGNINQLREKLKCAFDNRDKLIGLSANARRTIETSYNLQNYIASLNKLYTPHSQT